MCIAAYGFEYMFIDTMNSLPGRLRLIMFLCSCVSNPPCHRRWLFACKISCAFRLFNNNMPYPFRPPTWAVSSQDRTAFFNLDVAQADKHTYLEGLPSFEITRDHTPANQTKKVWQGYVHNTQKTVCGNPNCLRTYVN